MDPYITAQPAIWQRHGLNTRAARARAARGVDQKRHQQPGAKTLSKLVNIESWRKARKTVFFDRGELSALLSVYSEQVAKGDWRDYAIDMDKGVAMFSVFRHAHERPIFTVAKVISPKRGAVDWELHHQARCLKRSARQSEILSELKRRAGTTG